MMKRIIFLVIVVFLVLGVIGARLLYNGGEDAWICSGNQWIKHGNPSVPMPASGCGASRPAANFEKSGNLVDAGLGQGWNLLYEESGKPALSIKLVLDSQTICNFSSDCSNLKVGDRIAVSGVLANDSVDVYSLNSAK